MYMQQNKLNIPEYKHVINLIETLDIFFLII